MVPSFFIRLRIEANRNKSELQYAALSFFLSSINPNDKYSMPNLFKVS